MKRPYAYTAGIILAGVIVGSAIFLGVTFFALPAHSSSSVSLAWNSPAGKGISVPACQSASYNPGSCTGNTPTIKITWTDDTGTCAAYPSYMVDVYIGSNKFTTSCANNSFTWGGGALNTTYTYNVGYTLGSDFHEIGSGSFTTPAYCTLPTADFTVSSNYGIAGSAITFNDTSYNGTTPYIYYSWYFGDGTSLDPGAKSVSHVYATPGTYSIGHWMEDSAKQYDQAPNKSIVIVAPLTAGFSYVPSNPVGGSPTYFGGYAFGGSDPKNTNSYTYSWNFGDSTTGSGASVSHVYPILTTAKSYYVTLTVKDTGPPAQTKTVGQWVSVKPPPPKVDISVTPSRFISIGSTVTIGWSITGSPTSCVFDTLPNDGGLSAWDKLTGGASGPWSTKSSLDITPTQTGSITYRITCYNPGGSGEGDALLITGLIKEGG